jgi:hypothetical protein
MSDPTIHLKPGDSVSRIVLHIKDRRTGLPYDLTNAQQTKLKYEGVSVGTRTMTVEGVPTDGALAYQVVATDFTKVGRIIAQAEVVDAASKTITSDDVQVMVSHKVPGV